MKLLIHHVHEQAPRRPVGYFEDVIGAGRRDGEWLDISDDDYRRLVEKYRPGPVALVASAFAAGAAWAAAGFSLADEPTREHRAATCAACTLYEPESGRCLECGCGVLKLWIATERCPIGKW